MATFMSALLGCNAIDDKAITPIEEGLSKKYGKKFTVSALGDRIGRDTATAYVYADDDPTMRFVTRVNKEGEIVFENYAYRLVCRRVETIVNDTFLENGLNTECHSDFSDSILDVDVNISISEYIEESSSVNIKLAIIIKDNEDVTGEKLEKIFKDIYSKMPEINIYFSIFVLSEKDYDNTCEKVEKETNFFDLSRLKIHGIEHSVKSFYVDISCNQLSMSADEISIKLSEEEN